MEFLEFPRQALELSPNNLKMFLLFYDEATHGNTFPTVFEIAERSGNSVRNVRRIVTELKKLGYIKPKEMFDCRGQNMPTIHFIKFVHYDCEE